MYESLKKLGRTLMTFMPLLKNELYFLKRFFRTSLNLSVESDFDAIKLFPNDKDSLFLDVGGNQGAVIDTLLVKNKNCKIYSFEPNPEVYARTRLRFKTNDRVKVFAFGLGEREGEFKLFIPVYRGYKFDGLASLIPDFDDSWLSNNIFLYNRKFLSMHEVNCVIKRLDDLDLIPFFIKIDVEGFELEVLLGGEQTIKKSLPVILVESGEKDHEIMKFLEQFGYKMYKYCDGKFIMGKRGSQNSFLMTDEKFHLVSSFGHYTNK